MVAKFGAVNFADAAAFRRNVSDIRLGDSLMESELCDIQSTEPKIG